MISDSNHIIARQTIEIDFESLEKGMGVQNRISELFHERLLPGMENLFDEMVGPDQRAVIDRLEIDCGELSPNNWEQEWVEKTMHELKAVLRTVDKKPATSDGAEPFFFFLQHGRLSWNARMDYVKRWEEFMKMDSVFVKEFLRRLNSGQVNIQRLSQGFSMVFLNKIITALINDEPEIAALILQIKEESQVHGGQKKSDFIRILERIKTATKIDDRFKLKEENILLKKDKREKSAEEDEMIYIQNSGLVILHPFFPQLFESNGLIKENKWVDEESKQRAIQMMGFLMTGNESTEEFDMALNKILCGVEIQDVIAEEIRLTDNIRRSCEELLGEVIGHWKALKNTGIETFRETFLNRAGKLSRTDNGWLLQVEQKGVDVLMNKLPWGIGTIKLPWMHEIVYTEWAY
jgi:hypothetical protein